MKGWLDNFGKADNANDSEVNLPEGFVGLAYDTKGRNYSPAWGGQFAMGGSIPGSVGFTYARVAGAAPSKGKYAKKTMASAQNGQEMKFYQNGLDWKPKSMQEGGKIYEGMELPEIVIEGKDERIKNAMSQGMANFYGHVGELMGAPQKEMMQLITGKEQTPSQAFGFQNTGGWLDSPTSFGKNLLNTGLDLGLDPLNAVGVGLADDVFKLGIKNVGKNLTENLGKGIGKRAISQSPSPQMFSDDLGRIEVPNVSKRSDLEGTGFDQDKLYHLDLFEKKKQQVIDRLSTKKGRERLQKFINENYKKNPEAFGTNILELKNPYLEFLKTGFKDYKKFTPDQIIDNVKNLQFFESGDPLEAMFNYSVKNNNRKFGLDTQSPFGISVGESFTPYDALHILEHELGHFFQRVNRSNVDEILSKLELDDQAKNFELNRPTLPLEDAGFSQTMKKNAFTNAKASRNYFTSGTKGREKMPFLAEVRENLLQRGLIDDYYDDITPEILKKHKDLYDKTGGNKYILRLYEIMKDSPENFNILSNAINKMPQVALPVAGGAAATISALQNQQPVQKQKNGGITKDNLGYWNPDNWGKPVEIGSNNITMEGVYEPLLGVSDTGDTKLMQPGKNYKFKGKKVTEFPVAQWGEGVPFKEAATPTKNISNPLNLRKELVPYIKPKASFEEQKRIAKLELDKYGYTSDQRKGYVKGKSEKAFKNIVPQGYGDLEKTLDRIERYEKNLGRNPNETVWYGAEDSSTGKPIYYDLPKRDDAFALYLGLPQKNKSFGISEYQPGDSKENKYYYKPNYLDDNLKNRLLASYFDNVEDGKNTYIANERFDAFRQKTDSLKRAGVPDENPIYAKWIVDNPLGDFKMSKGKDEKGHYISIYDSWDLNPFKEGEGSSSNPAAATLKAFAKMKGIDVGDDLEISRLFGAGKPFEIYDRIYYDPKTKKVIPQKRNGGGVGINQLDAQPMKKLNQLLNFTNNPDKDNWLDKYN